MTRDYEDFSSIDDLSDDELRAFVRQRLADHNGLDIDDMVVEVENGMVRLQGRVGTEAELRMADHVLTDVVGIPEVDNQLVVDALRRTETSVDIDDHLRMEEAASGLMLGELPEQESPEVHQARGDENLDERLFGTVNVQDAIAHGTSYNPPTSPTPEGMLGSDAGPGELGEDH